MKIFLAISLSFFLATHSAAQVGGQFEITQSVIAGGGAESGGGNFAVVGTAGQTNAGTVSTGGNFGVTGGFWQASFAPTAAQVSVGGRVLAANGMGIRNVRLTLTNQSGVVQTAVTSAFGYFRFDEVAVGEIYILTVHSKRFIFSNGTQILAVTEEIGDVVFIADSQNSLH
jgi:hypothetical protein